MIGESFSEGKKSIKNEKLTEIKKKTIRHDIEILDFLDTF